MERYLLHDMKTAQKGGISDMGSLWEGHQRISLKKESGWTNEGGCTSSPHEQEFFCTYSHHLMSSLRL